jgi:hypothetical protein
MHPIGYLARTDGVVSARERAGDAVVRALSRALASFVASTIRSPRPA